uniref:Uncharacterized protein n=1 Tax=Strongyloides stercoralis TaxID=6248 RepID=A0A0K0EGY9_STRER
MNQIEKPDHLNCRQFRVDKIYCKFFLKYVNSFMNNLIDKVKRRAFCEWLFEKDEFHFHRSIYYSDEAVFYLNGHVNKYDVFVWATENPNVIIEEKNIPQSKLTDVNKSAMQRLLNENKNNTYKPVHTNKLYKDVLKSSGIKFIL